MLSSTSAHALPPCPTLRPVAPSPPQAVAIDEAQFFPDLLGFALDQAETHGRDVLVAGLSCDSARRR